jgi:NADH:ubiquinone oxidoreductase subunit 3 (subunit A)
MLASTHPFEEAVTRKLIAKAKMQQRNDVYECGNKSVKQARLVMRMWIERTSSRTKREKTDGIK